MPPRGAASDVDGLLLGCQQSVHGSRHRLHVDLPHGVGEDVDDLLMWGGHHALPVDFNDAVSHADASSLCYSPSHEAADNSVLDAEPQLVAKVWSPDQHGGYWGTPHDIQLHPGLILQALNNALAGRQRQAHQAGAIDGHDLVPNTQLP